MTTRVSDMRQAAMQPGDTYYACRYLRTATVSLDRVTHQKKAYLVDQVTGGRGLAGVDVATIDSVAIHGRMLANMTYPMTTTLI